jgi:hypothetical protein
MLPGARVESHWILMKEVWISGSVDVRAGKVLMGEPENPHSPIGTWFAARDPWLYRDSVTWLRAAEHTPPLVEEGWLYLLTPFVGALFCEDVGKMKKCRVRHRTQF